MSDHNEHQDAICGEGGQNYNDLSNTEAVFKHVKFCTK